MPKGMGYSHGYRRTNGGYMGKNATYNEAGSMGSKGTKNPHYESMGKNPNRTRRTFSGGHIHGEKGVPAKGKSMKKPSGNGYGGTPRSTRTSMGFSGGS